MNIWIRRALITLLGLAVLAAVAVAIGLQLGARKQQRQIDVAVQPIAIPLGDNAAIERGRYLYLSRGCADCHSRDGAGRLAIDDGGLRVAGPNLTPGGVVAGYKPQDWVRSVRHGVKPDGRPTLIMPTEDYARMTDADLGALVAYIATLAPASGGATIIELPVPVRLAYALGVVKDGPEKVDHRLAPEKAVPEGVTIEHGRYVAQMCKGCHGGSFAGGKIPGAPPDWPAASKLTPGAGSVIDRYADAAAFKRMFTSGLRPDGSKIAVMPFEALRELNDVDVAALLLYLKSLPPGT